ncbi:recombinase family protein [Amycolatopsis sp. CA-126428]|uniref:recombinase family protein n=1 Tax=Amycolatopsis sp. CA-126428 TaxID=2073158 RepID=UPI000CD060E8|nr:recombinase family protein [Amycolatopsis sp. CA-126428]
MTALLDEEPRLAALGPLAYGYMRVPADVPDHRVRRVEGAVARFAEAKGLYFVSFFFELDCGSREGFDELITELVRADARHVVVPSLMHLARNELLQTAMREQLANEANAEVHAVGRRTGEALA